MTEDTLLDKVLKDLFDQAFTDGVVTDDEFEIIQEVEVGVEEYSRVLRRAMADGIITTQEREQLEILKRRILQQAEQTAKLDGMVDAEEDTLLTKLSQIIAQYLV